MAWSQRSWATVRSWCLSVTVWGSSRSGTTRISPSRLAEPAARLRPCDPTSLPGHSDPSWAPSPGGDRFGHGESELLCCLLEKAAGIRAPDADNAAVGTSHDRRPYRLFDRADVEHAHRG